MISDDTGCRAIEIDGFAHSNPIPAAARIGPVLVSSMVIGYERGTTLVPDRPETQAENVFATVADILAAAQASWSHVVRMTFYVPDLMMRPAVNICWLQRFPDPATRPARITFETPSHPVIRAEFMAYVQSAGGSR